MTALDPKDEIVTNIPAMRAFARSLTRDNASADDLVQDAFEKAWRNLHQYKAGTQMLAWLFTIVRNTYLSDLRKISHRRHADLILDHLAANTPETKEAPFDFNGIYRTFLTLPLEQREAMSLVAIAGFTYAEAAKMCGVAVGTMKSRVSRARATLAEKLELE